jgi:hypothetical protein
MRLRRQEYRLFSVGCRFPSLHGTGIGVDPICWNLPFLLSNQAISDAPL